MKIKKENQLGLNFSQMIKDGLYKVHSEKFFSQYEESVVAPYKQQWKDILSDNGNKNLLFTKTAQEVADTIRIVRFQPSILKIKAEKKLTFLMGDKSFYRVNITQQEIFVLHVFLEGSPQGAMVMYNSFKINPLDNRVQYPPNQADYLNDKNFSTFLKLLIFVEYSELSEVVIKPNRTHGTQKTGKYLNGTDSDVVLVDSTWNSIIIRKEGFGVSGHLRMQKCGINREDVKLIYISEYVKEGYIRGAKKLKEFGQE